MAKTRVHELAKEFGVESKFVLEKLKEMGEFVKSASSTVEPPVEMRFKKQYGDELKASAASAPASDSATEAPAATKSAPKPGPKRATVCSPGRSAGTSSPTAVTASPAARIAPEPLATTCVRLLCHQRSREYSTMSAPPVLGGPP